MNLPEITTKIDGAIAKIAAVQDLAPIQIVRIGKDALEDPAVAEADLLGVEPGAERRKTKKSARLIFKNPIFVESVKFSMVAALLKKSIKITFFGAPPEKASQTIQKYLTTASDETLAVGGVIQGIEVTCSKPVSDLVTLIEIMGSLDASIGAVKVKREETANVFAESKLVFAEAAATVKQQATDMIAKGAELEQVKVQIGETQASLSSAKQELDGVRVQAAQAAAELDTLTSKVTETKEEIHRRQESLETLETQVSGLRTQKEHESHELNKTLDKKSFYNQKLEGHKAETVREIRYHSGIAALTGLVLVALAVYALIVLHGAADKIGTVDKEQLPLFFAARAGTIMVVLYFLKLFAKVFSERMQTIDVLAGHKRNLETKLILAQRLAETVCQETNLDGEAKRGYAVTVVWSILCNDFLNSSVDSVAGDFKVKKGQFKALLPKLPKGYDFDRIINDLPDDAALPVPPQPVLVTPKKETTA